MNGRTAADANGAGGEDLKKAERRSLRVTELRPGI
jgi:hypothetical protein